MDFYSSILRQQYAFRFAKCLYLGSYPYGANDPANGCYWGCEWPCDWGGGANETANGSENDLLNDLANHLLDNAGATHLATLAGPFATLLKVLGIRVGGSLG